MIRLITGILGSGKTLFLSGVTISNSLKGNAIYTNFNHDNSNYRISSMDEMELIRNGVFCLDDGYVLMSSKDPEKSVKAAKLICAKSRKRGFDIYITAARHKQIPLDVRYNVDVIYKPFVILSKKTKFPVCLVVRAYAYRNPEAKEEGEELGELYWEKKIRGSLLQALMDAYDTKEEVQDFNVARMDKNPQ